MSPQILRHVGPVVASLTLSACVTVGPDYQQPEIVVADQWHQAVVENMQSSDPGVNWWQAMNDPKLNELVQRAQDGNLGLVKAVARIDEALRFLGIARGERYPDADAVGGISRSKSQLSALPNVENVDDFSDLRVGATWELDFWGRVRRTVESSQASYEATVEAYRDVLVLLNAQVASSYVFLRTLQDATAAG